MHGSRKKIQETGNPAWENTRWEHEEKNEGTRGAVPAFLSVSQMRGTVKKRQWEKERRIALLRKKKRKT